MTEQMKLKLIRMNGFQENYRKQETAAQISKEYSLSKEIGILGDAVEYLFELVSTLHEDVKVDPAFIEWRTRVNEIKEKIKEDIR